MKDMTKMDKIWIATAILIYPETNYKKYISGSEITNTVLKMFNTEITPVMLNHHLVSFIDRHADKKNTRRGGSRNRYFFRTNDGKKPDTAGKFRLYKKIDVKYDGWDKNGKICPEKENIDKVYHYLIDWYKSHYLVSES